MPFNYNNTNTIEEEVKMNNFEEKKYYSKKLSVDCDTQSRAHLVSQRLRPKRLNFRPTLSLLLIH